MAFTLEQDVGAHIVPFLLYSFGDGGGIDVRQTVATGVGIEEAFGRNQDLVGLVLSWAQPADRSMRDQYTIEFFHRIYVTPFLHVTPDIQVIVDPSNNLDEDVIAVLGLRLRTLF
jgi:carbohydrate-selective porin OprB